MSEMTWVTVPLDVVRAAAELCDGHSIREPSDFVAVGVPAELVADYTEALESDFSDYKQTIHSAKTGKPLGAVVGIYGLHVLEGMVNDFRLKCVSKFGRGSQARVYQDAIYAYLAKKTPRPTPLATRIRVTENELDQIKPGTDLYKHAVDSLDESQRGWTYIQRAEDLYSREGEIEIDDDAAVSISEDGAYVQGWVWVPNEEKDGNA